MARAPALIAVVFDFDDTLAPDSTSKLLGDFGIDVDSFFTKDAKALVEKGYDPTLAYLRLLLDLVGDGKPLGGLTNAGLREFGLTLDDTFYPGIPELFNDLRQNVEEFKDVSIEFYIISGGLESMLLGSKVVSDHFNGVYGCRLSEGEEGYVRYIERCVSFTEKTRYLFEINKGIAKDDGLRNPYLVNRDIPDKNRRIPFRNIIYVGDGLTDIPCFSLLKAMHGMGFGVFKPGVEKSAKQALQEFLRTDRVISSHAPRYRPEDELGSMLRAAVSTAGSQIKLRREQAEID